VRGERDGCGVLVADSYLNLCEGLLLPNGAPGGRAEENCWTKRCFNLWKVMVRLIVLAGMNVSSSLGSVDQRRRHRPLCTQLARPWKRVLSPAAWRLRGM
jgi:hypothetical protein